MESLASALSSVNRLRDRIAKRREGESHAKKEDAGQVARGERGSTERSRTLDKPPEREKPPSPKDTPQEAAEYRFGYKEFEGVQGARLLKGILHNVLSGAKYQFWWSITEFQAKNRRAYVGVRKLAEYMGRSERTIRNHLNDFLAQGLMVIEQEWMVRASSDGSYRASRVRCKDFDPLYDLAYAYLCWMKSPEYIPPAWDHAEFIKHHQHIRERVKDFAAYQKYLTNKKPGPSTRQSSERSPIRCDNANCTYCYPEGEILLAELRKRARKILNAEDVTEDAKREIRALWNKHLQEFPAYNRIITESNNNNSNSNSKFESITDLANALIRHEGTASEPHTSSQEGDAALDDTATSTPGIQSSSASAFGETGPKQTSKREASERIEQMLSRLTAREATPKLSSEPVESEWSGEMEANQPEQQQPISNRNPEEAAPKQTSKHIEREYETEPQAPEEATGAASSVSEASGLREQVEANEQASHAESEERDIRARLDDALGQLSAMEQSLRQREDATISEITSREEAIKRINQALSKLGGIERTREQNAGGARRPVNGRDDYRPLTLGPLLQGELDRRKRARQAWRARYQCQAQSLPDAETLSKMTPREPLSHRLMLLGYQVSAQLGDAAPYSTQTALVNHLKRLLHFTGEAGIERHEEVAEQWLYNMIEHCLTLTQQQEGLRARTDQGAIKRMPWFITSLKNSILDACKALSRGELPSELTWAQRQTQAPEDAVPLPSTDIQAQEPEEEAQPLTARIAAPEAEPEPSSEPEPEPPTRPQIIDPDNEPEPEPQIIDPDRERFPTPLRIKLKRRLVKAGIQEPIEYLGPGCPECGCHFRYKDTTPDGTEYQFCCRCQPSPNWSDELCQQVFALLDTPPDEIRAWGWSL